MKRFTNIAAVFTGILLLSAAAFGQCVSLTTSGSAYTQNFDTLSNTAASTTNNLTITGWFMTESGSGIRDNEQYAVDTGASTTGDTYSYGAAASTERALGALRSGTLIPTYGSCYTNNTGATINSLAVAYTGEEWRLGTAARTDQINFEYSTNAVDLLTGTWTGVSALNFITPDTATTGAKNGNAAADRTALSSTISSLSIANGATFWIRWTDTDASGADDGLAVDDFSLTPQSAPPLPNLSINDVSRDEGSGGTTAFNFTVSLSSAAPAGGVTFDIATADGTATVADSDYVARSLTAQTIPQGSTSYTFSVTVNGDTAVETNETFFVNVTNVTGANVTDGQGQGTLLNDDVEPATVEFSSGDYAEDESQTAVLTVQRFGNLSGTTTVNYSTQAENLLGASATGGTSCTSGVDYIHASGTLTFAAEENLKEIQIALCGDLVSETDEFFSVYLTNPTGGVLGEITTAQVAIKDAASQYRNVNPIFIGTGGDSYTSSIEVSGAPTSIGSLRVTLFDFEHIDADDIDVLLVGPEGEKFLLMADAGGEDGLAQAASITFDDNAGQVLPDAAQIFTGKYEPTTWEPGQTSFPAPAPAAPYSEPGSTVGGEVTLSSVFAGSNANGTWSLYIRDDNGAFRAVGADGLVAGGWGIQFLAPTAAGVSVSGQVRTSRMPISGATVTVSGGDLTAPRTVRTNGFGYYSFDGLTSGQIYVVTVAAKRYTFTQPSIVLNVGENVAGVDFEAEDN